MSSKFCVPPFSLFVTDEGLNLEQINRKLEQTEIDNVWLFYLAEEHYKDAPKKRTDNRVNEGTKAPVKAFKTSFGGRSPAELTRWLLEAPDYVDLNRNLFAVIDKHSLADIFMVCMVCRKGVLGEEKNVVKFFPKSKTVYALNSLIPSTFEEQLLGYRLDAMNQEKPDLSGEEPY